jgi:pimeloyl-[acyl-carrier protein] methyl ester esterase
MAALDHFMTLQCYGSKTRKKEHVLLKDFLKKYPLPSHKILQSGLEKLAQSDYREQIASLYPALWVILGENDVLVPAKVGHAIHALKPQAKIHIIPTAAHQPFLSHPEECAQLLLQLLSQSFLQSLSPVHVAPQSEPL